MGVHKRRNATKSNYTRKFIHCESVSDIPERTVVSCDLSDSEQQNKHTQVCVMILIQMIMRRVATYL